MPKPKVVVVMPAYNAQHTIEKTWREVVAHDVVDLVIVVDDASQDDTMKLAQGLDKVDVLVASIGNNFEANQLVVMLAKQAGVKRVIARAPSQRHEKILSVLGADEVLLPEVHAGESLGHRLLTEEAGG